MAQVLINNLRLYINDLNSFAFPRDGTGKDVDSVLKLEFQLFPLPKNRKRARGKMKMKMQSHAALIRCKNFVLLLFLSECQKTHHYPRSFFFVFGRDSMQCKHSRSRGGELCTEMLH